MKDNRLLLMVMAWLTILPLAAQKKEISQARTILKNKKNVQQAEQLMTRLLKDSVNQTNQRIYELWYESVLMQYEAANEKMYLKQKQDTADFFALTQRMFNVAWALDSLDARPDKKGRVSPELRSRHASQLIAYRPNLFFGGTYHTRKGNYDKAYSLFETYMDCVSQPLFSGYRLDSVDTRLPEAAYWATYCGYRKHDPVLTLRHRLLALQDTTKTALTLQYMAEARGWLNDDSLYYETLKAGFTRFPESQYFFPRLVDYYNVHRQYTDALSVIDFGASSKRHMTLKIAIPENLDYQGVFEPVLNKYTEMHKLRRVKTTNFGTLFELIYSVDINDNVDQKKFIDELRALNGNMTINLVFFRYDDKIYES